MAENPQEAKIFESYSVPRAVWTLAIPTIITQLINIIYNLADTWYVGRTGNPHMVAALSVCMPVYVIMAAVANLFGIGGSSVISRSLGSGHPSHARKVFAFCLYGGLSTALVYALFIYFFRPVLIYWIGGSDDSYSYISNYMFITMVVGAIPSVGNVLFGHLVRSIGAAKQAGIGMSLGGLLNLILDPLFMFVLLPKGQEVTGAAIATLLSNTCALLYFIVLLLKKRSHPVFTLHFKDISFRDHIPSEVLSVGFPAALSTTLAMASNMVANALVSDFSSAAVAGMGVAKKINTLAFNTCMGLTQGVLPLIGYTYGSQNYSKMKHVIRYTGIVAFSFGTLCTILFYSNSVLLVSFFINEKLSVSYGSEFLRIIAFAAPTTALTYMINSVFQATRRRVHSLFLSILRKGVLDIPAMYLFKSLFGIIGVVWATPFAEIISISIAVILLIRFFNTNCKTDNFKKFAQ